MNQIVMGHFDHWSATLDDNKILWLTLDRKDKSVNSLNEEVLREFDQILNNLQKNDQAEALVIQSGKSSGFIVGADVESFETMTDPDQIKKLIQSGQSIFNKLANLNMTTIALIEGHCLGGGLELALCCDVRICVDNGSGRLGLPEVKLGIIPGWGGTVRLPLKVGSLKAMDLILSGRLVRPKAAKKMGIVEACVPKRLAKQAVLSYATKQSKPRQPTWKENLTNHALARPVLARLFDYQLKKKIKKNQYPAPFKAVESWKQHGTSLKDGLESEAQLLGELLVTKTSRNLVRCFFLQNMMKDLAKNVEFNPKHIHVIGAGVMGGDIAAWCAIKGFRVTLEDQGPKLIGSAIKRAHSLAKKRLKEPHLVQAAMDRLVPDVQGLGVRQADIIIEAITEKLEAKQGLFKKIEEKAKPECIFATNTSTIPLEEIGTALKDPSRLVGIHFFNPVPQMPLVEVVKGKKTQSKIIDQALSFVKDIDKFPIPVKSSPGFLVNRVLLPYMLEAVLLLEEGVEGPVIDKAAKEFGMPMGPIELGDTVGLDVCLAACEKLSSHFGMPVPDKLREYVDAGHLGKKTGQGFYTWKKGKPEKPKVSSEGQDSDIMDRMVYRMLNEAIACLREGIVDNVDLLDAGSIFGFGFPPFRGGVLEYAQSEGFEHIEETLKNLENRYGQRFAPDEGWDQKIA